MKFINTNGAHSEFKVLAKTRRSEAAVMELKPHDSTGGEDNRHDGEDQWLYVISGSGNAIVSGKEQKLETESLLLIEAGETHEIFNTGSTVLRTLNFYAPPAY
jgi:mannose-6-phosphate isomerase-like protein (cupin superfamily)